MAPRSTLFVPIAHDLTPIAKGPVECGPGTKAACDHAVREALAHPKSVILLPAGYAGEKYGHVPMWAVMEAYISPQDPCCPVVHECADEFNTLGEILAVVKYVKRMRAHGVLFDEVVFLVKDWHAHRVEILANEAFSRFGVLTPVRVLTHEAPGMFWEKALEPVKTQRHLMKLRAIAHQRA